MIKNMKWVSLLTALAYIISGVLLVVYPKTSAAFICDVIGIALIVGGVFSVVTYFMIDLQMSFYRNDFVQGVVLMLLGILVIYQKEAIATLIPFILSIAIFISGFTKLQDFIDIYRLLHVCKWYYVIMSLISIAIGLFVMLATKFSFILLFQIVGGGLIFSGLTDVYSTFYLSSKIYKILEENGAEVVEEETKDESVEKHIHMLTADDTVEELTENKSSEDKKDTEIAEVEVSETKEISEENKML